MRARQQRYLADVVRVQRERLEQLGHTTAAGEQATRDLLLDALKGLEWVEYVLRQRRTRSQGSVLSALRRRMRAMRLAVARAARLALRRVRAAVRSPFAPGGAR